MSDIKSNNWIDWIKRELSKKRIRLTLYMVAVLWVALGTQILVNYIFMNDFKITDAFIKTQIDAKQSKIEFVAEYDKAFLSEEDKKGLILHIANAIELNVDREIEVLKEDNKIEYAFAKVAKSAATEIKVVSIENSEEKITNQKHYIIVRLSISDSIESIDLYKERLDQALKELQVINKHETLQYTGNFDGRLSTEERNQLVNLLVGELQGKISLLYDEGDLYTIYAYSGLNNEYIVTDGKKVNIQIAISYNELTNKTKVYLATPILNTNW